MALTANELWQAAENHRMNGEIEHAVSMYEALMAEDGSKQNLSLVLRLIICYKKNGDYGKAIELGLETAQDPDTWDSIKQNIAWCIYFKYFKNSSGLDQENAVHWLETMAEIYPPAKGLHPLVLSLQNYISTHTELDPRFVLRLCDMADAEILDRTPQPAKRPGMMYPSAYERIMGFRAKALFSAGMYLECVALCESVQSSGAPLTQKVWVMRRQALAAVRTGDLAGGAEILRKVLREKKDWFVMHELADALFSLGSVEEAESLCLKAAAARGEIPHKVHLWELMRQIFASRKKYEEALTMMKVCASLRQRQGWKLPPELLADLAAYNIDPATLPLPEELLRAVIPGARPKPVPDGTVYHGSISSMLPHGNAGFVNSQNGSYYFKVSDCSIPAAKLARGLKVTFRLRAGFDPKKQQQVMQACRVAEDT